MTRTDLRIKFNTEKNLQVLQTDGTGYIHYTDDYVHWLEEIALKQANGAESKDGKLPITHVSGSGYPIHIYKWGTEKETYCGIDLNTKGISFVVSSQVRAFINDDKSKICQKCASYHYR